MSYRARKVFHGHPKGDRYRNEHDNRGNSGGNHGGNQGKNNYRNFSGFRGNDRTRVPDGHWRGEKDRRGGFRGGRNARAYNDEDGRERNSGNRREGMYKARGHRKGNRQRHQNPNNYTNNGWTKIIIREAGHLDRDEIMGAIRRVVQEPFTPVMYEPEGSNRVFYLEDNLPAVQAIVDLSRRVSIPSGQKLTIHSNRNPPPTRALTAEQRQKVVVVMSDRYCGELKRLDLKTFHKDPSLVADEIFCPICRVPNMKSVMDVVVSNIPQVEEIDISSNKVYSLEGLHQLVAACPNLKRINISNNRMTNIDGLSFIEGINLVDITLEGNPLCDKFRDTETYISAVRKKFPKVIYLDGQELPKPIGFEVDDDSENKLPKVLTSYFAVPGVRDLVLKFIEQYYQIYDSEDRSPLGAAYTEDALFSLDCNFPETGPGSQYTRIYMVESRNLKKVVNSDKRMQNLCRGRENIVSLLTKLPFTTHDPCSFTVDVPLAEANLIHVTLTGVFRQLSDRNNVVRSFSRTFVVVPQGSGYCICNEELFITAATVEQIKKAFKTPAVSTSENASTSQSGFSVSEPQSLTPAQEQLIIRFCEASGMLPNYSRMCLEQNNWDFSKAGELFTQLKAENKIPPEYFAQSP